MTRKRMSLFKKLDEDLSRRIISFLHQRGLNVLRNIAVDVRNGTVVIHGRIGSLSEKQLCLNCCQRVAGVIRLVDEIGVE